MNLDPNKIGGFSRRWLWNIGIVLLILAAIYSYYSGGEGRRAGQIVMTCKGLTQGRDASELQACIDRLSKE